MVLALLPACNDVLDGKDDTKPDGPSVAAVSEPLVRGKRNPLIIRSSGVPDSNISVTVTNGRVLREQGGYVVVPGKGDTMTAYLTYIDADGEHARTEPVHFEVADPR